MLLKMERRGVTPDKQCVVLDKVRAEVAEQISRRGVQSIVADRTGPQVDLERRSTALYTKPDSW